MYANAWTVAPLLILIGEKGTNQQTIDRMKIEDFSTGNRIGYFTRTP